MVTAHQNTPAVCIHTLHLPQVPPSLLLAALPSPGADFVPEPLWKQPVGSMESPTFTTAIPSLCSPPHLIPSHPEESWHSKQLWGKKWFVPCISVCGIWRRKKTREELFCFSIPAHFHSANSLFALLQSSTCLYLLPMLPAVYSTPHSHPVLLRSHPVLPGHFRPQAETVQVKNYSSIFTEGWPLLLLWRKKQNKCLPESKSKIRDLGLCPSHSQLRQPVLRNTLHSCHSLPGKRVNGSYSKIITIHNSALPKDK